jgi:DNA replication licensing factor MCM6
MKSRKHSKAPVPQQTVEFEKFARVKQALALRLAQAQASAEEAAEPGGVTLAGMRQSELLRWYLDEQTAKRAFPDVAALAAEYRLVKSIIAHLIRREGTLLVISEPGEEELQALPEAERRKAKLDGRVLALQPDYVVE